jgi:hypothetical protein
MASVLAWLASVATNRWRIRWPGVESNEWTRKLPSSWHSASCQGGRCASQTQCEQRAAGWICRGSQRRAGRGVSEGRDGTHQVRVSSGYGPLKRTERLVLLQQPRLCRLRALLENRMGPFCENPPGDRSFPRGLRWLNRHSPLRGCSGLAASASLKIPRRRAHPIFQTGSMAMARRGCRSRS